MKKLFFTAIIAVFSMTSMNAQGTFSAGVNLGLPVGDAGDVFTFAVGLDLNYMFEVADSFDAGIATGYSQAFLDSDFTGDDFQFAPIAAAGRYSVSEEFVLGADLGYAIGINDGNDGGFYYRPMVGYNISEKMMINASYVGISLDLVNYSSINVGVMFNF
jgi:hypothetical protein